MKPAISNDEKRDGDVAASDVLRLERQLLARGRRQQRALLKKSDMLSCEEVAARTGIQPATLNEMRIAERVLALDSPGGQQGFRFPSFQFEPSILRVMPRILEVFGPGRAWQAYDFLMHPEPSLGGKTPLDELRAGQHSAIEKIIIAVATLDQGAP